MMDSIKIWDEAGYFIEVINENRRVIIVDEYSGDKLHLTPKQVHDLWRHLESIEYTLE